MSRVSRRRRPRAAFTLIEVLLVLVILVVIGSLVGLQVRNAQKQANIKAAQAQIGMFKTPLEAYQMDINQYPSTSQGLAALLQAPADLPNPTKWGPSAYLDSNQVPVDPWDQPYQFMSPGNWNPDGYDIWSLGPDGQDGTDDDIGSWMQ